MFRNSFSNYRLVYGHLWKTYGCWWQVRVAFILQLIARLCKLVALPIAISLIISRLSAHDYRGAEHAVFIFVAFSLTLGIAIPLIKYIAMLGENEAYRRITVEYFGKLVGSDIAYFNSNLSGYLTSATRQYVDGCMQFVRAMRDRYLGTVLSIFLPLVVIAFIDPWLWLVTFALGAVQASYLLWASRAIDDHRKRSRELFRRNSGIIADIISNIMAVKTAAREPEYIAKVDQGSKEENDAYHDRYVLQVKLIAIREVITVSFFMVLLWLTVVRMSHGAIGITAAVLVVTYTNTILNGIYSLSEDLEEHDDFIDKIVPAFDLLNRQNDVQDPSKPVKFTDVKGDIQIDHVSFQYETSAEVLRDFTLHIPQGQKLGVVGVSGAGKSTLTKLLLRFEDVSAGSITIDGKDIRSLRQRDLRAHVAYVPQEPLLFHDTVQENVIVTNPKATPKQIEQALKAAHAWDFVKELPAGTDSIVGERGVKLSGGQKQRVAIARAVLQDAPIMILDEATSALDSESEQIIKRSFSDILRNRTAIVVAHRLSTLSEMDRIIVIDKGRLAEDGTHDELIAKDGVYATLWKRQQRLLES